MRAVCAGGFLDRGEETGESAIPVRDRVDRQEVQDERGDEQDPVSRLRLRG